MSRADHLPAFLFACLPACSACGVPSGAAWVGASPPPATRTHSLPWRPPTRPPSALRRAAVKAAGKWRQEGKTYEVQDGDIIHWKFNVTAPSKK